MSHTTTTAPVAPVTTTEEVVRYCVRDRETGTEIETLDTLAEAEDYVDGLYEEDRLNEVYEEDFYEIVKVIED